MFSLIALIYDDEGFSYRKTYTPEQVPEEHALTLRAVATGIVQLDEPWQATHVSGSLVTGEDGVEAVEMAVHARRKKDGATKTFTSADYPQFRLTDADSLSFFKYFTSAADV